MKRRSQTAAEENKRKTTNSIASASKKCENSNNELQAFDIRKSEIALKNPSLCLVTDMFANMDVAYHQVLDLGGICQNFLGGMLGHMSKDMSNVLKDNEKAEGAVKGIFNKIIEDMVNPMTSVHMCFKEYERLGTLIMPLGVPIPHTNKEGEKDFFIPNAQIIPLRKVLQKFFSDPNLVKATEDHMNRLRSTNLISNFVQGSCWKSKCPKSGKKLMLPLILHFQTYEKYNPLIVYTKDIIKIGEIFVEIPCLPPEYSKDLQNIFTFVLFCVLGKVNFNHQIIMSKVIEELEFLRQKGISVSTPTGAKKIYFELGLVVSDRAEHVGFKKSCNGAKICTYCLAPRAGFTSVFSESQCTLRDKNSYERHLEQDCPSLSGIQEACELNLLNTFHVTENFLVDYLEVFLMKVCRHDMAIILNNMIFEEKVISYEDFSARLLAAKSDHLYYCYKPKGIREKQIKSGYISLTAPEMFWLISFLPYIMLEQSKFDPKIVLKYDQVITYTLYQKLAQIISALSKQEISNDQIANLDSCIKQYFEERNRLLPNAMSRQHHTLLHCSRFIGNYGPLWNFYMTRLQKRIWHRENISKLAVNPLNVVHKIAMKIQLILNSRLLTKDGWNKNKKNSDRPPGCNIKNSSKAEKYKDFLSKYLEGEIFFLNSIDFEDTRLRRSDILRANSSGNMYQVCEIVSCNEETMVIAKLICKSDQFGGELEALFFEILENTPSPYCLIDMETLKNCTKLSFCVTLAKSQVTNYLQAHCYNHGDNDKATGDSTIVIFKHWFERF